MSAILRSIAAVLVGYVVFAASSFAVFRLSGHAPHAPAPVPFMLLAIASGVVFAALGGYVAGSLAGRRPLGHGAIWTQVAALTLMAPSAVLGGWLRARTV